MTQPPAFDGTGPIDAADPSPARGSFQIRNCRMAGAARISLSFEGPTAVVDFHGAAVTGPADRGPLSDFRREYLGGWPAAGSVHARSSVGEVTPAAEAELERVRDLARGAQREAWQLRKELDRAQERVAIGTAAGDVLLERERHPLIGWTPEHDRAHGVGHLVTLAEARLNQHPAFARRGDLVEAAALLLAAIDVLDWSSQPSAPAEEADRG